MITTLDESKLSLFWGEVERRGTSGCWRFEDICRSVGLVPREMDELLLRELGVDGKQFIWYMSD